MRHLSAHLLALLAFALLLATEAQLAAKIPRLCFLAFDPGTLESSRFKPFFEGLRDLGWVGGQTITFEYLSANGRGEQFPAPAADCLRLKADIIVADRLVWGHHCVTEGPAKAELALVPSEIDQVVL